MTCVCKVPTHAFFGFRLGGVGRGAMPRCLPFTSSDTVAPTAARTSSLCSPKAGAPR